MRRSSLRPAWLASGILALACSGGTEPGPTDNAVDEACRASATLTLQPGELTFRDLGQSGGCLRLDAAGAAGAEYVVAAYSGSGLVLASGIRADALFASGAPTGVAARTLARPEPSAPPDLHARLRQLERRVAPAAAAAARARPAQRALRPAPGERREFLACADLDCASFTPVVAFARYVGDALAIYVDSLAPAGGFTDAELDEVGRLFDGEIYRLDTLAFGAPSDVDANGVVIALLTPAVNRLSGAGCANGIVLGYFSGLDLAPGEPGSNGGEVFFSLVPDPASATCPVSKSLAVEQLPVTFMHELQHMISYNQHVLVRGGDPEATWLNEGLSHFAEELGGRRIPDAPGSAPGSRRNQFAFTNVDNAYGFLLDTDRWWLVMPGLSTGAPEERGAAWLFVRWLADHFAGTGDETTVTRRLVATSATGAVNVEQLTGRPFDELVGTWLLASHLDDTPGATLPPLLGYPSWEFRRTFESLRRQDPGRFPRAWPVVPLEADDRAFARRFTLRGGSGLFARVQQPPGGRHAHLRLTTPDGQPVAALAVPRAAIVRLR